MQEIAPKHICTGCHACYNICPTNSISMCHDEEGFLYPEIDGTKCVNCEKCKKVCPVFMDYSGNENSIAYACVNNNEQIRIDSSSGGVFSLLAENVIACDGVVFGAAFDEEFDVKHICVQNDREIYKLRGSKYVQSTISDAYKEVEKYLKQGRQVLFSGTPCQIGGLKTYLKFDYDNLILVDLICHGVPSPKAWRKYLQYQQNKYGSRLEENSIINFRDKRSGWYKFSLSIKFNDEKEHLKDLSEDLFMKAFLNNLCLRKSCYNCHFKSVNRQSDITLADFWGVKEQLPEMFDNKGTSLVLVNTDKGKCLFENISDSIKLSKVDINKALKTNTAAYKSCEMPKNRTKFMASLDTVDFKKNVEECTKPGIVLRIKKLIKRGIRYVQK